MMVGLLEGRVTKEGAPWPPGPGEVEGMPKSLSRTACSRTFQKLAASPGRPFVLCPESLRSLFYVKVQVLI